MNFATHYKPNRCSPEINSGEIMVEKAGYIPAQKLIENLINAGQRLKEFRSEQFDFPDEKSIDHTFMDPTRIKNFDMADASQMSYKTEQNIKEAQRLKMEKQKELEALAKASQTVQDQQNNA